MCVALPRLHRSRDPTTSAKQDLLLDFPIAQFSPCMEIMPTSNHHGSHPFPENIAAINYDSIERGSRI